MDGRKRASPSPDFNHHRAWRPAPFTKRFRLGRSTGEATRWRSACGQKFVPLLQAPRQAYCVKDECQKERRRLWQTAKRRSDPMLKRPGPREIEGTGGALGEPTTAQQWGTGRATG